MMKAEPNPDHAHEALDRTHVLASQFQTHVLEHPYIAGYPDLLKQSEAISKALGALYRR